MHLLPRVLAQCLAHHLQVLGLLPLGLLDLLENILPLFDDLLEILDFLLEIAEVCINRPCVAGAVL